MTDRAPAPQPLWTSAEIAVATGGRVTGSPFQINGIDIDSREVQPGDLFVALTGERDGADFVDGALGRGASAALVSRPVGGPAVLVDDTLRALERMGEAARDRAHGAKRAAVTGSVGKTSVTQAIAASIALAGRSHTSIRSFNNHIGVPLTLARMPRDTELAVFEIGMNHANEITPLSRMIRPHVAVVTTVGPVHVENFPDGEAGVARAKAEIFDGLEPGGVAILPAEDKWFEVLSSAAKARGARIVTFGRGEGCDARLLEFLPSPLRGEGPGMGVTPVQQGPAVAPMSATGAPPPLALPHQQGEGNIVRAILHGETLDFPIAQSGAHWGLNALATILAVEALGAPVQAALDALSGFAPLAGRGQEHAVDGPNGRFTVIDESYNANPISMRAALATLAGRTAAGRRIVVISDMLEIGADAPAVHAGLAPDVVAAGVDLLFAAGPASRALYDALAEDRRGAWRDNAADLAPLVAQALGEDDVVMIKGSKGSKASLVVDTLLARGGAN